MSFHIAVNAGSRVKLPTAGTYCDRDILIAGNGYTDADLQEKYDEGFAQSAQVCAERHFVGTIVGNGSSTISFHLPFEPDALQIIGYEPLTVTVANAMMGMIYDLKSFGQCAGLVQYANGNGGITTVAFSENTAKKRYSRTEDGSTTITGVGASNAVLPFLNSAYVVIAVKYAQQTDTERITAFVARLTGSGTVSLNQARVTAAFTEEEWAALIAAKPNWTFNWI